MKQYRGFTMIELVVSIAVIGILSAVILFAINPVGKIQMARNAQRKADLSQFKLALASYNISHGQYPVTPGVWCGPNGSSWYNCGDEWIPGLVTAGEMNRLAQDPLALKANASSSQADCSNPANNAYIYFSNGSDYKLVANCTPEGSIDPGDPFNDPNRSGWSYAIWTSGAVAW